MKKEKILKWFIFAIALAINLFIIINAFINGEASAKESDSVAHTAAEIINTVKPETITPANYPRFSFNFRKAVGHFGLFGVSGIFTTWSFYLFLKDTKCGYFLYQLLMTTGVGLVLALISEFTQIFIEGRSGNWLDVGIDFFGYFLGISLLFLIFLFKKSPIFLRQNYKKNQAE